ncbi:YfbM family protein [Moraxella oblonga]|uniref:YfbM family protein n=1 Tax=Moraxella oblonga TaxID=200413 RepID=UPI00082CF022|nr:YfbM family protein [Moraxella oblonga]
MGIYASYYALDDNQVKEFKALLSEDNDDTVEQFYECLEEIEDNDNDENYTDLDKLWDGLHFLLTGFDSDDDYNANKTPEQLALYYAFFGNNTLSDEGVYLVDDNKLADIVKVLENINIDELLNNVDFEKFAEADLYPDIWYNEDKDDLADELKGYFETFKQFYQNALKNNRCVCVIIG